MSCAIAHVTNAQWLRAKRGDVVPYDEAVITNLATYRMETRYFDLTEKLVDSLTVEIGFLREELALAYKIGDIERSREQVAMEGWNESRESYEKLSEQHEKVLKQVQRQKYIWNRKEFWLALGVGIGIIISK